MMALSPVGISDLIPGFSPPQDNSVFLAGEKIIASSSWLERLSLSEKLGVGFAAPGGFFTRAMFENILRGNVKIPLSRFKDSVVVELGAGGYHFGYELSVHLGARGYIGVEPFYFDALYFSLINRNRQQTNMGYPIPWSIAPYDMLSFLKGLPDDTVSLFTFGIERCILGGETYRKAIEGEITRVLSPSGGYLSSKSDLAPQNLFSSQFSVLRKQAEEIGRLFLK